MKSIVYRDFSPENSLCKCTGNTSYSFLFIAPEASCVQNQVKAFISIRKKTS